MIELINNAKRTIHVQAYSFTSQEIIDALIKAYNRGVSVHVLIDRTSLTSRGSRVKQLINNGIDVEVCHVPGIAHNKVLIVDEKVVSTGSYNFTQAAETRNAENIVVIKDPKIVQAFIKNWHYLKFRR